MENEDGTGTVVEIASTGRRKAPARKGAASSRRKPAARSRAKAPARRKSRAGSSSFEGVIRSITSGVTIAREAIAEASGQGATAVRRAVGTASKASRKTVTRLANEWKQMDPKKKAGVLAALLGAAAAASAPLVRKSLKK